MTSTELENLARLGKLKREGATQAEFDGLVRSGRMRLGDAQDPDLAPESREDAGGGRRSPWSDSTRNEVSSLYNEPASLPQQVE
jgi:hypothetical protein